MIELINPEHYFDFINTNPVSLIHFWAAWNAYDQLLQQRLKELEPEYKNIVRFGSVDVDKKEMMQICIGLELKNVPALAYYVNGSRIETVIGLDTKEKIKEKLQEIISIADSYLHR